MGLDTKIRNTVDKVFKKYAELTVPVVFTQNNASGFDFSTGENITSSATITTTGFINESTKKVDGRVVSILTLIVKTPESSLSAYTNVSVEGVDYSCAMSSGNKYVSEFEVVKK